MGSRFNTLLGTRLRTLLKLGVSAALLGWLLAHIDGRKLLQSFAGLPLQAALGAAALFLAAVAVGALKWFVLIRRCRFALLLRLMFVAQYYAILLPGQIAAEVVKAYKLNQVCNAPQQVVTSVIFDRMTGWIALLLVGLYGLSASRAGVAAGLKPRFIVILAVLAIGMYLVRLRRLEMLLKRLVGPLASHAGLAKIGRGVSGVLEAWRAYVGKPLLVAGSIGLGLVFHLLGAAICFLLAGGLQIGLPFADWCWMFAAISLVLLLPVAVGGIGLRESAMVVMLGWQNVPAEKALAVSLSFFGLQVGAALVGALLEVSMPLKALPQPAGATRTDEPDNRRVP